MQEAVQDLPTVRLTVKSGRILKTELAEAIGLRGTRTLRQDLLALCSVCDVSQRQYVGKCDGRHHSIPIDLAQRLLVHLYGEGGIKILYKN